MILYIGKEADSANEPAGAPGKHEIEVTAEMIEAGVSALLDGSELTSNFSLGDARYFVEKVLKAALALGSYRNPATGSK